MILQVIIALVAGGINRHQPHVITDCSHTRRRYFIALLSLWVSYRRPHRVPRRVLLVRVGGAKNGRLVEPLCHNLQTNGQRVPGEAAGDGYSGNTG